MNYLNIDETKLHRTIKGLNALLASYHIYYQNLRSFHWNVTGENFFELHRNFEDLYNDARLKIDEIAERIQTLRHRPLSRITAYMKVSEIKEAPVLVDDRAMVEELLENHAVLIHQMRQVIRWADTAGDDGTMDLIGGMLKDIEKSSWMLNAWAIKRVEVANPAMS